MVTSNLGNLQSEPLLQLPGSLKKLITKKRFSYLFGDGNIEFTFKKNLSQKKRKIRTKILRTSACGQRKTFD